MALQSVAPAAGGSTIMTPYNYQTAPASTAPVTPVTAQKSPTSSTTVSGPSSTSTPTVISDNNIRNNVIPDIKADAAKALPSQTDPYAFKQGETVDAYKARIAQLFPQTQNQDNNSSSPSSLSGTATDTNSDSSIYDKLYSDAFGSTPQKDSPYDADFNLLRSMQSSSDATTSNTLASIASQYTQKRNDLAANQQIGNQQTNMLLNRTGANRSGSGSQLISAEGRGYIREAANLDLQEQQATSAALAAQSDNNFKLLGQQLGVLKDARAEKLAIVNKLYDNMIAEKKQAQQDIQSVVSDAAKNGAPPDVLHAISSATDANAATQAAGAYLQTATGQLGDYVQYKKDTISKGLTPTDYSTWKAQDDTRQAKLDSAKAYNNAYGAEAGKAAADNAMGVGDTTSGTTPDATAGGITGATGLSLQAFNYLTQGTTSMSRMPVAQRNQIMKEANDFLNKNGIDISTFQSQYKAYNDVLQSNLARANNTKIFAGEITGTVDQFVNDIGNNFSSLKAANVVRLLAGEQVNDPTVQKYAFDLQTMQNDLAGYYAASRTGAANATPDDSDKRAAAAVILNGINGKSAAAFKQSIMDNEQKVTNVVSKAANDAQKQVWDLFGVGGQYKPKAAQVNPKDAVDEYVKENPDKVDTISKLYTVPGATDQDVWDYIQKTMQQATS